MPELDLAAIKERQPAVHRSRSRRYDHVELLAGLLSDSMLILRDIWTAGSAEGRFRDLWNLAGRVDAVLEPKSVPIFMPEDLG